MDRHIDSSRCHTKQTQRGSGMRHCQFFLHRKTYLSVSFRDKQPTEETNALFYVSNISQVMPSQTASKDLQLQRKRKHSMLKQKSKTGSKAPNTQQAVSESHRSRINKQTIYFINPIGKLQLSFDRTTKNISQ